MFCQIRVHLVVDGCEHDLLFPVDHPVDPRLCASGGGARWTPSCGCLRRISEGRLRGLVERELHRNLEESLRRGFVLVVVR